MDLQDLRVFLAVVEEGSISGGARRLYLAQPAVTRRIKKLERHVGGDLLHRTKEGVGATPAGAALAGQARALLSAAANLEADVRDVLTAEDDQPRSLSVGLFLGPHAASDLTGPILTTFRARHPGISLELHVMPLTDPWGHAIPGLDVLLYREFGDGRDAAVPLFQEPRVITTGEHTDLAAADSVVPADLDSLAVHRVTWQPHGFGGFYDLDDVFGADGIRRYELPRCDYTRALHHMQEGGFVGCTGGSSARLAAMPGLAYMPLQEAPPSTATVAVRRPSVLAAAFARHAAAVASDLLALVPEATAPDPTVLPVA
jgi:DNA-binding transcriptional LysR family regulator